MSDTQTCGHDVSGDDARVIGDVVCCAGCQDRYYAAKQEEEN